MRYDAQDAPTSQLMDLVERTEEKHPEAIRRDLRPHKTVVHTPSQTTDARKGEFTLRVNFRSGEAVFRADRNDPEHLIPEEFREMLEHSFIAQPLH